MKYSVYLQSFSSKTKELTKGTHRSTTKYTSKFIYQNNAMPFIFQPESDVKLDGMDW